METIRRKSLKTEFFAAVSVTLLAVALASALTAWGCLRLQKWLVPDTRFVMVHMDYQTPDGMEEKSSLRMEVDGGSPQAFPSIQVLEDGVPLSESYDLDKALFSVESVDYGIGWNGPRRKLAYIGAGIAMGLLPLAYSVLGFFLCALWFYRKKLSPGIILLEDATRHIAGQDLDFSIRCSLENELGRLCRSFEEMRLTLKENNQKLWKMIEERKLIQASIAHDLRNPIAIIEGYAEYLQLHLQAGDLAVQKLPEIAGNIGNAAKRLEQYTESVRAINQLDDMEASRRQVPSDELIRDIASDLAIMAKGSGKSLHIIKDAPSRLVSVDAALLYRILENILNNALRFAKEEVSVSFLLQKEDFLITVSDDGDGFPEEILRNKGRLLMPAPDKDGHCGLGLTISRLLCQKHDGRLELYNRKPHGAVVRVILDA